MLGGGSFPRDVLTGINISYGYGLPLMNDEQGGLLRVVLRGGVMAGTYSRATNFRESAALFAPNYDYERKRSTVLGLTLQPGFVLTPASWIGIGAGAFANFNSMSAPFGAYGCIMLGRVAERRRKQ